MSRRPDLLEAGILKPVYWFKLPDNEAMLMELKPAQLQTYLVVARAIQRDKNAGKLSVRQVAARAKLSPRHAFEALEDHVQQGRLNREGKPGSTATYSLPFGFKGDNCIPPGEQLGQQRAPKCIPTGEQRRTPVGTQNCAPVGEQHLERESSEMSTSASAPASPSRAGFQHHQSGRDDVDLNPYQRQVLEQLRAHTGTPVKLSQADQSLCGQWEAQGISMVTVGRAIVLGCLRKHAQAINSGGKVRMKIYSLKYFAEIIAEAQDPAKSSQQWEHEAFRLKRVESGKSISVPEAAA